MAFSVPIQISPLHKNGKIVGNKKVMIATHFSVLSHGTEEIA
jgi:hypothetical protein